MKIPSTPLTQKEMDKWKCPNPACEGGHPVRIMCQTCDTTPVILYDSHTGLLLVGCDNCDKPLAKILVAQELPQ
jgi:hypothetical protein